jgi:membrane associated rhomboid family serine protease
MRGSSITLALPPFPRAIKTLKALNAGIYVLFLVMSAVGYSDYANEIANMLALRAQDIVHGRLYELVTYGFIHTGFFHVLFNMLMVWMFGSMLEVPWGSRKFWEFYLFGMVGAALGTVALAYALGKVLHFSPLTPVIGSSGALYAIYMAVAMLFGNQEVFMFPLPIAIRLKYLVGILAFISFVSALGGGGGGAVAQLTGLLFGYLYIKFVPRRGFSYALSEGYYGMNNSYHRWKRRRAARKFQVYMRKHEHDPKQYFDEYGNFKPPDDKKKDGGPGGWVN